MSFFSTFSALHLIRSIVACKSISLVVKKPLQQEITIIMIRELCWSVGQTEAPSIDRGIEIMNTMRSIRKLISRFEFSEYKESISANFRKYHLHRRFLIADEIVWILEILCMIWNSYGIIGLFSENLLRRIAVSVIFVWRGWLRVQKDAWSYGRNETEKNSFSW